jgi:hypothetical protein
MNSAAPVLLHRGRYWYCSLARRLHRRGMLNMLTAPALTLMFLIVVVGLGTAFIWMFWEIEQISRLRRMSRPHRKGDGIG